jgi:hypothetical protein
VLELYPLSISILCALLQQRAIKSTARKTLHTKPRYVNPLRGKFKADGFRRTKQGDENIKLIDTSPSKLKGPLKFIFPALRTLALL